MLRDRRDGDGLKTLLDDLRRVEDRLDEFPDGFVKWDPRPAICVVMASQGYPGSFTKGKIVSGLASPDGVQRPTFDAALTTAEIKADELDRAWKRWVITGK